VSLSLFDVRGRLVRRLVSSTQGAGVHTVNWDGRDAAGLQAASGVYFYRLATETKTLQRKMLVVR
jgi:flagellar hook assembly protein FlgD